MTSGSETHKHPKFAERLTTPKLPNSGLKLQIAAVNFIVRSKHGSMLDYWQERERERERPGHARRAPFDDAGAKGILEVEGVVVAEEGVDVGSRVEKVRFLQSHFLRHRRGLPKHVEHQEGEEDEKWDFLFGGCRNIHGNACAHPGPTNKAPAWREINLGINSSYTGDDAGNPTWCVPRVSIGPRCACMARQNLCPFDIRSEIWCSKKQRRAAYQAWSKFNGFHN